MRQRRDFHWRRAAIRRHYAHRAHLERPLKTGVERLGHTTLVIPEGRLDFSAAGSFQQQLEAALGGGGTAPVAVIIDCAALDYVSSAGLRSFLLAARAAQRAGILLALAALQPAVREVFELSGFSRLIAVHPDRATALAHTRHGPPSKERRTEVPGDAAQLAALTRFLQGFWSAEKLPPAQALGFELALEEIFINVVMHGSPAGATRVELLLVLSGEVLTMTLEDDGPPFDPLSVPAPNVSASLEQRPVGGQGVFLVRSLMDTVGYERVGGRNKLTMAKRIERQPPRADSL